MKARAPGTSAGEQRELSDDALLNLRNTVSHDLAIRQIQAKVGQLEDTSTLRVLRQRIARANTELRRREILAGFPKGKLLNAAPSSGGAS